MITNEPLPGIICPSCKSNPVETITLLDIAKRHYEAKQTFRYSHDANAWCCPSCDCPYAGPHVRKEKNQTPLPAREETNVKRATKKQVAPVAKAEPMRLSHSQIETWEQCRLKWRFQKIDQLQAAPSEALIFGTALHAMLEADGKRIMDNGIHEDYELLAIFDGAMKTELMKSDHYGLMKPDRPIAMRARAQDIIKKYIALIQPTYKPLAVEEDFTLILDDGTEFRGRIDAITATSILDWKTASKPWEPDSQHHKDQATAYLLAVPGAAKVSFAVFSGEGDNLRFQSLATTRTELQKRDYQRKVIQVASDIKTAITEDDFPANPGPLCGWCPMLAHCTAGRAWLQMKGRVPQVPVLPQSKIEKAEETE